MCSSANLSRIRDPDKDSLAASEHTVLQLKGTKACPQFWLAISFTPLSYY